MTNATLVGNQKKSAGKHFDISEAIVDICNRNANVK